MEIIDDDAERANIQFVKINDKRLGKSFGIKKFPALTMIRFLSKTDYSKSSQNNFFNYKSIQPTLTLQGPSNRNRDVFIYEGDLKDEETVLEFLTDDDNFSMGDKIEEVDAENLINIIETDPYVSVFFYDDTKESSKALEHMEDIDDETDVFNIRYIFVILLFQVVIFRFLRINDPELADDYSLKKIPCLVFFR